jgi:protein-disulfide isomerase
MLVNKALSSTAVNWAILVLCAVGIFIAGVLSYSTFGNLVPPCGNSHGCETIAIHPSSKLFGKLAWSYIGLGGYLGLFLLAATRPFMKGDAYKKSVTISFWATVFGVGTSLYLVYTALFAIGASCIWCMASAGTMILLCLAHGMLLNAEEPDKTSKASIGLAGIALIGSLAAVLIVAPDLQSGGGADKVKLERVSRSLLPGPDRLLGSRDAKIAILEFGDFNCPSCRAGHDKVKSFVKEHQDKVVYGFRHFPLYQIPGHETSPKVAMMAQIAAEQDLYFEFIDAAYAGINENKVKTEDGIIEVAAGAGLNVENAIERLSDKNDPIFLTMEADYKMGFDVGVTGTPTFLIMAEGHEPRAAAAAGLFRVLEQEPFRSILAE